MINTALLKEQLKRFWGLSALFFVFYSLTIVLPIFMDICHGRIPISTLPSIINLENNFIVLSALFAPFAPLVVVIALFKFQNQVRSVTTMNSYPLSRNQLFVTNALIGIILLTLPLLVFSLIMIFPLHQFYYELFVSTSTHAPRFLAIHQLGALPNSLITMHRFFFITALTFLFHLSIYITVAMLSGNSIITLLLCIALSFLQMLMDLLVNIIRIHYPFGHIFGILRSYTFSSHEFLFLMNPVRWKSYRHLYTQTVLYFVIIIAMTICCFVVVNKRALERTGDSFIFPYVKNIMVFVFSACGLLLSVSLLIMFSSYHNNYNKYIWFVISFFITYCIAQMIDKKTFNILDKMKGFIKFGAVAVVILLIIIISIFRFERHVPRFADIEGIQLIHVLDLMTSKTLLNELLIKDAEIIDDVISLHQTIIRDRETLSRFVPEHRFDISGGGQRFNILYKLKNQNLVVRSYYLPEPFIQMNDVRGLLGRVQLLMPPPEKRPYDEIMQMPYIDLW